MHVYKLPLGHSIGFASGYGWASAACEPFGLRVIASPFVGDLFELAGTACEESASD